MNRDDFNILNSGIIYFDNGATTLKPKILSEAISDYYNNYSSNAHRGDYTLSIKASQKYEETRYLVKDLINARKASEIAFTSGTTDSINKIVFGYFENVLTRGDEILLTRSEHASNLLPWFELADKLKLKIKYIELDENHEVLLENVEKAISDRTKVISIAHISNVVGDVRPIKEITELAHKNGILVLVDGAQSVPHLKVDVQDLDIDFLVFSAHKMCGPTGVGVLYGKEKLNGHIYELAKYLADNQMVLQNCRGWFRFKDNQMAEYEKKRQNRLKNRPKPVMIQRSIDDFDDIPSAKPGPKIYYIEDDEIFTEV